ncbi:Ethylene-insensitive protein 2 [Ancistrocladus abbreviatus]
MEPEASSPNNLWGIFHGLLPTIAPALFISVGYIDPGKWAACIDSGAHFGGDLVAFMIIFNLVAILFQYLSAHISVVSGRSLAQICHDEYDRRTSILLGIQAELSMILLDLTMIIGIAQGLNMVFGVDLFSSILLTALNVVLFPLFSGLLENSKMKFLVICVAGLTFLCYIFGMLISQPEFSVPPNSVLLKFSGENVFALMSLLGANVIPHNFYLHSSILQRYQGPSGVSKGPWSYDNFFAIISVFSGIFLVNYVLMNSAANVFNGTGLVLLTFQDAVSQMDQAFRSPIAPFGLFLVMFLANQISALSWELGEEGGQTILHDFFGLDLPGWLHRATVRIFAILPALYCLWHLGAEGMYQMLIFSQVMVALLLPSSMIPLFRVAASRPIMGVHKMSPILEFVALITIMGVVVLEIIFVVEMIFGDTDWVGNLRWNMANNVSGPYIFLLIGACISLSFMLWLFSTPLKSASARLEAEAWNSDVKPAVPESFTEREKNDIVPTHYHDEEETQKQELVPSVEKSLSGHSDIPSATYDLHLPETLIDTVQEPYLPTIEENSAGERFMSSERCHQEKSSSSLESVPVTVADNASGLKTEPTDLVEKTLSVECELPMEKDDDEGDTWEPEESSKGESRFGQPVASEGPGSIRSLSGKNDEGGNGAGSLSRLSGLGRAARRQLAAALDEFWGQLYDFHGQITQEAKAKRLDLLFGVDSKPSHSLAKADSVGKDFMGQFLSLAKADSGGKDFAVRFQPGGGTDSLINTGLYDTLNQQKLQSSMEPAYGAQRGSLSSWSPQLQPMEGFLQGSSGSGFDTGERRYSSLHLPAISDGLDYQPATVHGYQLASYLGRIVKDRPDYVKDALESGPPKSPSIGPNYRDPVAFALRQKPTNGVNFSQPPGFHNRAVSRNSPVNSDRSYYDLFSSQAGDKVENQNTTKKYHSLPDISGLSPPFRGIGSVNSDILATRRTAMVYGQMDSQIARERSLYSNIGSRVGGPMAFDTLSSLRTIQGAVSLQSNSASSVWYKHPFDQFGIANKRSNVGTEGAGDETSLLSQEPASVVDVERKLLHALRHCILKLLKLEGSQWLFRQNDGIDEEIIERVATRERFLYEVESRDIKQEGAYMSESQYTSSERKPGLTMKVDEAGPDGNPLLAPHCGESCVWKVDLVVSFGVWCIHRILELSLMESRPELWGKYTYVLNRLQGIIDMAFFKPRSLMSPCFCLQIPVSYQQRSSPPVSNGMPPPLTRTLKGEFTTAAMLLEVIKDVEVAISCRKGRSGTAAGDVAFPKGKENLASVLKRYKRRLSNKPVGTHDGGLGARKLPN